MARLGGGAPSGQAGTFSCAEKVACVGAGAHRAPRPGQCGQDGGVLALKRTCSALTGFEAHVAARGTEAVSKR
eukprot:4816404-Prymnesium_polylepis.2